MININALQLMYSTYMCARRCFVIHTVIKVIKKKRKEEEEGEGFKVITTWEVYV